MNILKTIFTASLLLLACNSMAAGKLKLEYCGDSHGLVRIIEQDKYLLIPIEDAAPEAHIRVLADNEVTVSFNARLAMNHIDYYVPFDLTPYAENHIIFDVRTIAGRDNLRTVQEAAWSKNLKLSDTFDTTNREKFRPTYHHTPTYAWMNDPNGMFYKDGEWHLCFQYGPYGSTWNNMTWGHSTTRDLVNWEAQPNAITPDGLGMIFSGSCVIDTENVAGFGKDAIIAFYTSADRSQMQSLAYSNDNGQTYTSYKGNPIITSTQECRDPHVFYHEPSGKWILILAAAQAHEMWIYSSSDLINWTKESAFGHGYGCQNGVWECPDLVELPIRGTDEKRWVLICNLNPGGIFGGSATQYFVGDFDGHTFTCDNKPEVIKWMDFGKDHYAAVSWHNAPENRTTVIAWMSNWQYAGVVPTTQFRSANTLPRDLELFRGEDGELYVAVNPSPEIEAARGEDKNLGSFSAGKKAVKKNIPENCQGACEIVLEMNYGSADVVNIELSNREGEKVLMTYNREATTFTMNRNNSGKVDFSADFPAVTTAPTPKDETQELRIFIDSSSIEAFEGSGKFAMTNLVFPTSPYNTLSVWSEDGKCKIKNMKIYSINKNK